MSKFNLINATESFNYTMSGKQLWISEGIKAYIPQGIQIQNMQQPKPQHILKQTAQNKNQNMKEVIHKQPIIKLLQQESNDHKMMTSTWQSQQLETLLDVFTKLGPKWSIISQSIPHKTNNTIKNKFYGKLRKVTRKLNILKKERKILKKIIKYESVLRIIQPSKCLMNLNNNLKQTCEALRLKIIDLVKRSQEDFNLPYIQSLIQEINKFNLKTRSYRTKKSNSIKKKKLEDPEQQDQKPFIKQQINPVVQEQEQLRPTLHRKVIRKNILICSPQIIQNNSLSNELKIQTKQEPIFFNNSAFMFPYFRFNSN